MSSLPQSTLVMLQTRFTDKNFLKNYPAVAMRVILTEARQQVEGFRPIEEITQALTQACPIKRANPSKYYKILNRLG